MVLKVTHKLSCRIADRHLLIMDNSQLSGGQFRFQWNLEQIAGIMLDAEVRHESDTKTDGGQIDEQVIGAELDLWHQIQLLLLEQGVQELTGGTVTVQHKNRVSQQFLQREGLMLQLSIIFPAGYKAVVEILDKLNMASVSQTGVGIIGEDQIYRAAFQQIHASDGSLVGDLNVDVGVFFVKPA